jgi:peptide-methionine (R)-S-oxide reductase
MSKVFRFVVPALVITVVAAIVAAQGAGEPPASDRTARAQPATDVELASSTPSDWDYDPDQRVIYGEDEALDYPITLSEDEWRRLLDPTAYAILREKGTEPAFTHPLNTNTERGVYYSRATGQPLFSSEDKYDSRSGWPSFVKPINPDAIVYVEDNSLFSRRIEVVDSLSGSHLGHVFPDGPEPTGQRYCINGAALVFVPEGGDPPPLRTP